MNEDMMSVKSIMDSIVPISRFNKGEANKIFDEVAESGFKVVLKNNTPACVLLPPDRYEAMIEALEDYALYFEAEKRLVRAAGEREVLLSEDEVYRGLGIQKEELAGIEVELEE